MTVRITVVPASTKAGKETIRVLLQSESKPFVRAVYRDSSKAPESFLENPNFEAVQGDVGKGTGLDFRNSDAVFYIPPPTYDGTDQGEWASCTATNIRDALKDAPNVRRLLILSALGSQNDHSIGVLRLNHISDTILKDAVPEVTIVRPGYFQEDWAHLVKGTQAEERVIQSWIVPADYQIPMVSLKDVAEFCAGSLLGEFDATKPSPHYFKLFGPRHYSSLDLRSAVEKVTGNEGRLELVQRDQLASFFAQQIPDAYVQEFVDMVTASLPGGIISDDYDYDESTIRGRVELVDALGDLHAAKSK